MHYYAKAASVNMEMKKTAGVKARDDLDAIVETCGYQPLPVAICTNGVSSRNPLVKIRNQIRIYQSWKSACAPLKRGDTLFFQFPLTENTVFFQLLCKKLIRRGVVLQVLIHDIETLREAKIDFALKDIFRKIKVLITEKGVLKHATWLIVHNEKMKKKLETMGIDGRRQVTLEMFDYLIPDFLPEKRNGKTGRTKPVIIAGNLNAYKAAYAYHLPEDCEFNLYGIGFSGESKKNIHYFGAFPADEVPYVMEGSFGLIWDGQSAETCTGMYGEYMKINNPHKTSLYLAAGIPIVIWKQAALADFALENKVGIVIDSLAELRQAIDRLTDAEYAEMAKNAEATGKMLRAGAFIKAALKKAAS